MFHSNKGDSTLLHLNYFLAKQWDRAKSIGIYCIVSYWFLSLSLSSFLSLYFFFVSFSLFLSPFIYPFVSVYFTFFQRTHFSTLLHTAFSLGKMSYGSLKLMRIFEQTKPKVPPHPWNHVACNPPLDCSDLKRGILRIPVDVKQFHSQLDCKGSGMNRNKHYIHCQYALN